jgi:hypothetical protein
MNPRVLSEMASCDVASNICQALPVAVLIAVVVQRLDLGAEQAGRALPRDVAAQVEIESKI